MMEQIVTTIYNNKITDGMEEEIYMEIMDILGKNFDLSLAKASSVSEQITTFVTERFEEEVSNAES